jgi:hypothetical protein
VSEKCFVLTFAEAPIASQEGQGNQQAEGKLIKQNSHTGSGPDGKYVRQLKEENIGRVIRRLWQLYQIIHVNSLRFGQAVSLAKNNFGVPRLRAKFTR